NPALNSVFNTSMSLVTWTMASGPMPSPGRRRSLRVAMDIQAFCVTKPAFLLNFMEAFRKWIGCTAVLEFGEEVLMAGRPIGRRHEGWMIRPCPMRPCRGQGLP